MDTSPTPPTPPSQFPPTHPASKKGLGTGAKVGIGCGVVAVLVIVGTIIASVMWFGKFSGKFKEFADEAQKNPARATATMMVTVSGGSMTMVAEDDANKRYTVKETKTGTLTTIYWSEAKKAPEVIQGDFSAIPTTPAATGTGIESEPVPEAAKE